MRVRRSLRLAFLLTLFAAAAAVWADDFEYDHVACNCWDGWYICTFEDENHQVKGVSAVENPEC